MNVFSDAKPAQDMKKLQLECEQLQLEQRLTVQQLSEQTDVIASLKNEKHSLLATIQLLQQELDESEQQRMRNERTMTSRRK